MRFIKHGQDPIRLRETPAAPSRPAAASRSHHSSSHPLTREQGGALTRPDARFGTKSQARLPTRTVLQERSRLKKRAVAREELHALLQEEFSKTAGDLCLA